MRISVELVPRNSTDLLTDAATVQAVMPEASVFNIPDLSRFSLRSWEACALTSKLMPSIPHIRAMDIPPGDEVPLARTILESGLSEVLVIQGDPPHDVSKRTYPHTSVDIIRRFKKHHPELNWNREFAKSALRVIRSLQANVYFMPIRVDLAKYLTGLA